MADGYNGWTNYETWNVNLWIDNDEGSQMHWQERAEECLQDADSDPDKAVSALADELKQQHEDEIPDLQGTYGDLLRGALSEVNWHEISKSIIAGLSDQ